MKLMAGSSKGDKKKSYKSQKGYSRVGGILKSEATKKDLEKRQERLNSFTPSQNKQVAQTVERNVDVESAVKKGAKLNSGGNEPGYEGDQRYKKIGNRKVTTPKFKVKIFGKKKR